jgi:hypothetical protein
MAGRLLLIGELNDDLNELKISFEALGLTVDTAPDSLAGPRTGQGVSTGPRGVRKFSPTGSVALSWHRASAAGRQDLQPL